MEVEPPRVAAHGASSARLEVMNFLNQAAEAYPQAISFASGRPAATAFALDAWIADIPSFAAHFARTAGMDQSAAFDALAQYGRTNGIINDLIARQVLNDEQIHAAPHEIIVTGGCQEALDLLVKCLCSEPGDLVLTRTPCYIGITGAAHFNKVAMLPIHVPGIEQFGAELRRAVAAAERAGKRPKVLYLVPDFDNPTGIVIPRAIREDIIAFCAAKAIVILEDNPYGMFRYSGQRQPTMYSLDRAGCVVYVGTYSKTICPTARIGFAIVRAGTTAGPDGAALIDSLSQAKSFSAVNTSQLSQALVGGLLLREQGSLGRLVEAPRQLYRANLDAMLACLEEVFAGQRPAVSWNIPEGGFFLTVTLPRKFGKAEAERCACDFGVIVMPLSFFGLGDQEDYRVRMAFSNTNPALIREGIHRFGNFVRAHL